MKQAFRKLPKDIFEETYFKGWHKKVVGNFDEFDLKIAKNWFHSWIIKINKYVSLQNGENKKVLEIGCSIGAVANLLTERRFKVWATDISKFAIKRARHLTPKAHFSVLDVQKKISLGTKFDYVFCLEVVEHLEKPEVAIKNMYDVLNKNGKIILSTPYPYPWHYSDPTHINIKHPDLWVKILKKKGFRNVRYHRFTLFPFFYRYNKNFQIILPFSIPIPYINSPIIFIGEK